jgi:hypothetical protein
MASFIYFKKYHILCFDFLSSIAKKLLTILLFLLFKFCLTVRREVVVGNFLPIGEYASTVKNRRK